MVYCKTIHKIWIPPMKFHEESKCFSCFWIQKVLDLSSEALILVSLCQAEWVVGLGEGLGSFLSSCSLGQLVLGLSCPSALWCLHLSHTTSPGDLNRMSLISTHMHFSTRMSLLCHGSLYSHGQTNGKCANDKGEGEREKKRERLIEFSFSKALLRLLEIFWWVEGSGTSIQLCLAQKPGCFLQ